MKTRAKITRGSHSLSNMLIPLLAGGLLSALCYSHAFAESSFRGITVNDTPESFGQKIQAMEGSVKWVDPSFAMINLGDENCGFAMFDTERTITRMNLYACFFKGGHLNFYEFVERFTKAYETEAMIKPLVDENCKGANPMVFYGRLKEGEVFEITDQCVVSVEIRPATNEQPTFE